VPYAKTLEDDDDTAIVWSYGKAAQKLGGINSRTVSRLVDDGELASLKIGRRRMITVESVRTLIDRQLKLQQLKQQQRRNSIG
jgi:excisionase family DNA binding protein